MLNTPVLPKNMFNTPVVHQSRHSAQSLYRRTQNKIRVVPGNSKAIATSATENCTFTNKKTSVTEKFIRVKAIVTTKSSGCIGHISDLLGHTLTLDLLSGELDPKTGLEKPPIKVHVKRSSADENEVSYETDFSVPGDFGEIGAVFVQNEHTGEIYLKKIELVGFLNGPVHITCNSYVQPKSVSSDKRIFFSSNKSYLPSQTPSALKRLRQVELENLRGNGQGERKGSDKIYDYDVYNDLGNPDSDAKLARRVLGGKEHPYPRRCRTGRARCETDPRSETRSFRFYVPRDEAFSEVKETTFFAKTVKSVFHEVVTYLKTIVVDKDLGFPYFTVVDSLYSEGLVLPPLIKNGVVKDFIARIVKIITDTEESVLRFATPQMIKRDKFSWFRDGEFSRQTLAGINPYTIELVTEWPLKCKLDPKVYGPPESAITKELVEREIGGFMSLEEAVEKKRLFMLDYHDLLLPYVNKVRELDMITTLYGSRTLFFLNPDGTLRPIAIELTRPPANGKSQWKQVFTPDWTATGCWLWRLAKAHVLAHDSSVHQPISHWLRTHCCVEPYVIATNRQLSAMHPIYRLLHPHLRYTMQINAFSRESLINADGIIESSFSPGKYSMELSSVAYDKKWRFDLQALPADLISRGMAVEDPSAPHGLKLAIEDYPFANDGLLLWDTIKQWVTEYVSHYYPKANIVESDEELQAWWTEIRTVGHGDKKEGWPELKTPKDLIGILTTMIWVTSGHHAAVNFGQYDYAGYFPNRPTIARKNMPTEEPTEKLWKFFLEKPEATLLMCFPSQVQASKVTAILGVLSSHSPDEEYLGEKIEAAWNEEPAIKAAFERYNGQLKKLEGIIDSRNIDENLKNRSGAGVVPYELLKPFSESGVTGKGVPNSISI